MSHHTPRLSMFYRPGMSPSEAASFSKSPTKPRRFMEFLRETPVWNHVDIREDFKPLTRADLMTAHTFSYVDAFLYGEVDGGAESNGIDWSEELRDSVLLTNSSLFAAISAACASPATITMSPTSGFHHATPRGGQGFCTFSGQVIAGLELYRSKGLRGAWIDLDGHYGNSIDDSMGFAPDLEKAIPVNINPTGRRQNYLNDLTGKLLDLGELVMSGKVDYVCVAHGADSHEWDQLGSQCTTKQWLEASTLVYSSIRAWSDELGRPVPTTLALFGGYRDDHPESVLGLHAMDTARALFHLGDAAGLRDYVAEVRPRG